MNKTIIKVILILSLAIIGYILFHKTKLLNIEITQDTEILEKSGKLAFLFLVRKTVLIMHKIIKWNTLDENALDYEFFKSLFPLVSRIILALSLYDFIPTMYMSNNTGTTNLGSERMMELGNILNTPELGPTDVANNPLPMDYTQQTLENLGQVEFSRRVLVRETEIFNDPVKRAQSKARLGNFLDSGENLLSKDKTVEFVAYLRYKNFQNSALSQRILLRTPQHPHAGFEYGSNIHYRGEIVKVGYLLKEPYKTMIKQYVKDN